MLFIEFFPAKATTPAYRVVMRIVIEPYSEEDRSSVLRIESEGVHNPLDEEGVFALLGGEQKSCIVARQAGRGVKYPAIGYAAFTWTKLSLVILSIAVDPEYRRNRIGTRLVERMNEVAAASRKNLIVVSCHERREDFTYFLRECGFSFDSSYQIPSGDSIWVFSRKVRK